MSCDRRRRLKHLNYTWRWQKYKAKILDVSLQTIDIAGLFQANSVANGV